MIQPTRFFLALNLLRARENNVNVIIVKSVDLYKICQSVFQHVRYHVAKRGRFQGLSLQQGPFDVKQLLPNFKALPSIGPLNPGQWMFAFIFLVVLQGQSPAVGQSLRQKVNFANSDINAFWYSVFQDIGKPWKTPAAFEYVRRVRTPCGIAEVNNAIYCLRNHAIYVNIPLLVKANQRYGDFAAITILAHEYGHAVQRQLGLSRLNQDLYQEELQADCFAGSICPRCRQARTYCDPNDVREGYYQSFASGSRRFHPNSHGTRSQRAQAHFIWVILKVSRAA